MDTPRIYRAAIAGVCLVGTAGVGWLDYASGYEISTFPLYALPIAFMAWSVGAEAGALLALLSGVVWWLADRGSGNVYSRPWIGYINASAREVFFLFVVLAFSYGRRTVNLLREQVRNLSGPVPICRRCGRLCDLDGHWNDLESYLQTHTAARPVAKLCPDCARAMYSEGGEERSAKGGEQQTAGDAESTEVR